MSDRELLEMAAKAVGYDTSHLMNRDRLVLDPPVAALCVRENGRLVHTAWNPLESDADALRLAVKLSMGVQSNGPGHWQTQNATIVLFESDCPRRLTQAHDSDPCAATRRAIVRAAAAIAKDAA